MPERPVVNFTDAQAEQAHADAIRHVLESNGLNYTEIVQMFPDLPVSQQQAIQAQANVFMEVFADRYNALLNSGVGQADAAEYLLQDLSEGLYSGTESWATELARLAGFFDPCTSQPAVLVCEDNAPARLATENYVQEQMAYLVYRLSGGAAQLIGGDQDTQMRNALQATENMRHLISAGVPVQSEAEVAAFVNIYPVATFCVNDTMLDARDFSLDIPLANEASDVTGTLMSLLPTDGDVPNGMVVSAEGERTSDDVAAALGDPADGKDLLNAWGWRANVYRDFELKDASEESVATTYLSISIHQFDESNGASQALDSFVSTLASVSGYEEVPVGLAAGQEPIGDEALALTSPSNVDQTVTLYARIDSYVVRVTGLSPAGDPLVDVERLTRSILNRTGATHASPWPVAQVDARIRQVDRH